MKKVATMNCSEALLLARDKGMRVSRLAWNGEETMWIGSLPSEVFGLTCETFGISGVVNARDNNKLCPVFYSAWTTTKDGQPRGYATLCYEPTQEDILATDWFVIDNNGIKRRGQGK